MVYVYGDENDLAGARLIIGIFSVSVFNSFQKDEKVRCSNEDSEAQYKV